jgi:hypothetical protein
MSDGRGRTTPFSIGHELHTAPLAIRALGTRFKFAALWVVNNYGDPPVKIAAQDTQPFVAG